MEATNFHPIAEVLPQALSDGSMAYNVGLYDQDGKCLCVIGCVTRQRAEHLAALANEESWADTP